MSLAPGPLEIQAGVPVANSNSLRGRRNLDPELFCDEVDVKQAKSFDWIKEDALWGPNSQAPVVQKLDSAIHRINHYPTDKC